MEHSIVNDYLKVSVLKKGAEIKSILSKKSGKEYMWGADSQIWGSHAPVLFPAIGSFKNNECTINGIAYNIPKHGIIRNNEDLKLVSKTDNEINFQLDYSEKTLLIYPYKFRFNIIFRLQENKLVVFHKIENLDDKEIYFSLGGHPGFKCPINKGEEYEDYFLEFEKEENASTTLLSPNGLISDNTRKILDDTKILPLHSNLFADDALIFKDLKSRKVSLRSKKSNQVFTVSFSDFSYLGIWAKPNAPFVCIEPWLGIADHENTDGDFLKKDGLITLSQDKIFTAQYSIEIEE